MRIIVTAILAFVLAGCAGPKPLETGKVDPAMSALQIKAQSVVNEARRLLISADQLIGESAASGIWTPDEAQRYLDRAKDYRKKLDAIQEAVDRGDYQKAITDGNLTQVIADALLKELIAAKARGRPKPGAALTDLVPFLV